MSQARKRRAQVDNGATAASSAAPSAAMQPAIPGEPISLLLKESVIVILQKDGGVDNMEVQGTIALQVCPFLGPLGSEGLCVTGTTGQDQDTWTLHLLKFLVVFCTAEQVCWRDSGAPQALRP